MFRSFTCETLPRDRWEKLAKHSLYNQLDWLSLWETIGARPMFFLSSSKYSDQPAQAFSCLRFGSGLWSRAQSSIDGLAARFLSDSSDQPQMGDDIRNEILGALKQSGRASATWVDYRQSMNPENLPGGWRVEWIETHRLDVSAEVLIFSGSAGRHIKSGRERGAVVTEIKEASQVERCYELMQHAYRKFGRSRMYPREFYRRLFDYLRMEHRALWYICQVDGNIIGSLIALIEGSEALSWQPFIDRNYTEYKPAYLMLARLVEDARKLKLDTINLGGSPPGASGLIGFKERFGAGIYRYPMFVSQAPWYGLYRAMRT